MPPNEQAERARARGNHLRLTRARAHEAVAALPWRIGRDVVAGLIEAPPDWLDGERVSRVLRWPDRVDVHLMRRAVRAAAFMTEASAVRVEGLLVRELTGRQRAALAAWLRGDDPPEASWWEMLR